MKKLCFLLAVLLVFTTLTGCQKKATDYTMLIEIYAGKAQEYIDSGDTESAIAVLNEGIAATERAEKLTAMLDTLSQSEIPPVCPVCSAQTSADAKFCTACGSDLQQVENQPAEPDPPAPASFDPAPYYGIWAESDIGWQYGGMILEIGTDGTNLQMYLSYTQSAPASRVAEVYASMPLADVQGNVFHLQANNDGWGHTADIELSLGGDSISCTVANVVLVYPDSAETWGLYEGDFLLVRNDFAYQAMQYTQEMYDELYGEDYTESQPAYDTSKASGILASLGMTEAEFRASCQRLLSSSTQLSQTSGTELYYSDLVTYPNNYIDKHYVIDNISRYSYDFECTYKDISSDGYPYYEDTDYYDYNAVIYDYRDDPYSPNITQDDAFTPYVIFKGVRTVSGEEWLVFWMISVDMQ